MENSEKRISWKVLTFMCFSTLWGFGNVLNGYVYFNGMQVIVSWIGMFLLYFVPYAFMVGELGSAFKDFGGGVTSWIQETTNTKLAYYAGWTYWAVHITYIASKGSGGLKALSWLIFQDAKTYDTFPKIYVQLVTLGVLLFFCWLATRGLSPIKKLAYYAGWTYWAVHITYIASKGSGGLKALSWLIFQDAKTYDTFPKIYVQLVTLGVLLFFCWLATRGLSPIKKLSTIAGSSMFVMGILFIVMMFAAPAINPNGGYFKLDWSLKNLIPNINMTYLSNLAILVFAVGGIEKISPYVNKMEGNPSKEFPKGIMLATLMVVISALFGTIAMALMFDVKDINANFNHYVANGAYLAFQKVGEYYHVGNLFLMIYAACNAIGQFSTLLISIDAPLRMLLEDPNASRHIPKGLLKRNDKGAFVNGIILVAVLSGIIVVAQMLGGKGTGAATVLAQLTKLNSVTMPLRYLWVFVAYMALKKVGDKFTREYYFVKSKSVGFILGAWCFFVTAACCIMGMWSKDTLQMMLNFFAPVILVGLGLILPIIRRAQDNKENN